MGRTKKFKRETIFKAAIPLFWSKGYLDTNLHEIEKAAGVRKSGIYSEFKDKEDLFVETLKYYYQSLAAKPILEKAPLGWDNIEFLLKAMVERSSGLFKGCFGVNSMRETGLLPPRALKVLQENRLEIRKLFLGNIRAQKTRMDAGKVADLVITYFSGFCIEQNLRLSKADQLKAVEAFLKAMKAL